MKRAIVNFAKGGWYPTGQKRLVKSFEDRAYDGDFCLYGTVPELGCPSHEHVPYGFKAYALKKAMDDGYDQVVWADASVWLCSDHQRIWDQLDKDGYMFHLNGWNSGIWCCDAALPLLELTREEAFKIPHMMATVMGLDFRNDLANEFLDQYYQHALKGTFCGPWTNNNNEASSHPDVLGHRHDQTVASVVAWRLGMKNWLQHWITYDRKAPDDDVFVFKACGG